jgi:biopolymer transport protein ExbD
MNASWKAMRAVAVALLATVGACDSGQQEISASGSSLPAVSPSENVVTIRVLGNGKYGVNEARNLAANDLTGVIAKSYGQRSGTRVVRVLGSPGVTGYEVIQAVNAARAAGARRVDGVADYSEDGSTGNRKVWSEPIEPLPASEANDTALH